MSPIGQASKTTAAGDHLEIHENVVERMRRRTKQAKQMGYRVRAEWLDGEQATWCEVGGVKTIFIDLSQSTGEQLQQLEETLSELREASIEPQNEAQSTHDLDKRAA